VDEDLRQFGLTDQVKIDAPFGVWAENWDIVTAFLALEYSWVDGKTADGGQRRMLGHTQIMEVLSLQGVKRRAWPEMFNALRFMETEALNELYGVMS